MSEEMKILEERCTDLQRRLEEARAEADYYRGIAEQAGKRELRRVDDLTRLIEAGGRAEEALRESEERFRRLSEAAEEGIAIHDRGMVVEANEALARMFGYALSELKGMNAENLATPESWQTILKNIARGYEKPYEAVGIRKDGSTFHLQLVGKPFQYKDKELRVAVFRDLTEQRKMEQALRESEEQYRTAIENSNDGVAIMEGDRHLYVSRRMAEIFGYERAEELLGKRISLTVHPDDRARVEQIILQRQQGGQAPSRYEFKGVRKDGRPVYIEVSATRTTYRGKSVSLANLRDVTERKQLEAQFQAAQRLESLGTLAGGLAHDFNNLLMGVQGRTSLMLADADSSHPHFEHLKGIEDYVRSAADLTRQLLGFARGGRYEVKPSDLNEILKKTSSMFARTKKEMRVHVRCQDDLWVVEVDQGQIQQVLMNLYVNAWQAMPGGGDLYLETENVVLDEHDVKPFRTSPGKYVKIFVEDTGVGMDEKTRARLFEPFFTTKEMGRGTGLGLASVYGIIKNHGGMIDVYSEKGEGTTFAIYLPASDKTITREKKSEDVVQKGCETILLVDDEEMILDVGKKMLEKTGYTVFTARGGREAIDLYKADGNAIDLVVLDMIMPGMGGGETYEQLKGINPNVKVLLSSGYSLSKKAEKIVEGGCNAFIQKPFTVEELSTKLREVLDRK